MRKNYVILNHVDLNHINTKSNEVDLNHADPNHLFPTDSTDINDSDKIHVLNKLLSWDRDLTDEADSIVSKRTPFACISSIHTSHTPSPIHKLHFYPLVFAPQIFTYATSDPPLPSHVSSEEIVSFKSNPNPCKNTPNPVLNVPADPDSDTFFRFFFIGFI